LTSRGYPAGLEVSLGLEVSDPYFEANRGGFVLQVRQGEGRLQRSGRPGLRCDIQALSALYSGYRSVRELARLGRLAGSPEAIEVAGAVFSGGAPSMADSF
jgi:predicted acetyltransferase